VTEEAVKYFESVIHAAQEKRRRNKRNKIMDGLIDAQDLGELFAKGKRSEAATREMLEDIGLNIEALLKDLEKAFNKNGFVLIQKTYLSPIMFKNDKELYMIIEYPNIDNKGSGFS
jgi:hypothetical protein